MGCRQQIHCEEKKNFSLFNFWKYWQSVVRYFDFQVSCFRMTSHPLFFPPPPYYYFGFSNRVIMEKKEQNREAFIHFLCWTRNLFMNRLSYLEIRCYFLPFLLPLLFIRKYGNFARRLYVLHNKRFWNSWWNVKILGVVLWGDYYEMRERERGRGSLSPYIFV